MRILFVIMIGWGLAAVVSLIFQQWSVALALGLGHYVSIWVWVGYIYLFPRDTSKPVFAGLSELGVLFTIRN